ncbi:hypothetical protein AB0I49_00705 [Streptomyces sp. NPDC050617]|uniref:hypothetical protein n=1 Tax=Streptomyces sp. NPDC050617 TaxID=3154628 RepID=UPI0034334BCE
MSTRPAPETKPTGQPTSTRTPGRSPPDGLGHGHASALVAHTLAEPTHSRTVETPPGRLVSTVG